MSGERTRKLRWTDFIGSSIAGALFIGQIVLCVLFYNWGGLDALLYLGWAILALGMVLGWRARVAFQGKGGAPDGESWLATTVVVDTGIYAVVRHPMYSGVLVMILFSPLALGSYWAIIPALFVPVVLVIRIRDEEEMLLEELPGYREYTQKTRYRLIPDLW